MDTLSELDIVLSKINTVKICLKVIERATLQQKDEAFQLSIYELNLQRAIQACIALANIVIAKEGLGLPNTYDQSFEILRQHSVIDEPMEKIMTSMVGFRNISVHDYEEVNPDIVRKIVQSHLSDFESFSACIFSRAQKW